MAKPIILSSSFIREVDLRCHIDQNGVVTKLDVNIIGGVVDENGDEVKPVVMETQISALAAGTQSDLNGLMRELSQEFNIYCANEASVTWTDL